jgi:membrane-associated phospholipid phosphatase
MRRLVACVGLLAAAGQASAAPGKPSPFRVEPWRDGATLALGLTLWIGPMAAEGVIRPPCDPCDPDRLNALDRPVVRFGSSEVADRAGDVMVAVVSSAAFAGSLASLPRWGWTGVAEDMTLIAESVVLAGALNQIVRFGVRRPRPFMYRPGARPELRDTGGASLSFYSGHTSTAFAAASSFAYTWSARRPGSDLRPLVWLGSLMAATSVALLRVGSGEHFWSDVIVGAAAGTCMGIVVPALHRRGATRRVRAVVSPTWAGLQGRF